MITEAEMRQQFHQGFDFPPLMIRLSEGDALRQKDDEMDAILKVVADEQTFEFAAEFKSRNSPRIFEEALPRIERVAQRRNMLPMLVVPYLRESQLEELQKRKLSGIDLSGNGVVTVAGKLLVYRTGAPNKFPDSAPTKYAYRGATSLVARAFLCKAEFQSLAGIEKEIQTRGGNVALSTISKALKRLESDLIVDRTPASIRLRQPDKLLENLAQSYSRPKFDKTTTLKINRVAQTIEGKQLTVAGPTLLSQLPLDEFFFGQNLMVLTGQSSVENYAVMGRQDWPVFYTPNIDRLISFWGKNVEQTSRFIDLELRQTKDPTVYFDVRIKQYCPYASPVQAFLECFNGDKRERETALQIKELILCEIKEMKLVHINDSRSTPDNVARS